MDGSGFYSFLSGSVRLSMKGLQLDGKAWFLCCRSGEAGDPLCHGSESCHKDREQREAQRVGSDEGKTITSLCIAVSRIPAGLRSQDQLFRNS